MSRQSKSRQRQKQFALRKRFPLLPEAFTAAAKHLERFGLWVVESGGEPKHCTNPYEVARYVPADASPVRIIYRNLSGEITFDEETAQDWSDYRQGHRPSWARPAQKESF